MIEPGGVSVTWGVVVLTICVVATAAWIVRRHPRVVAALLALVGAVHAVAYGTAYLDAARLADVRSAAIDLAATAFLGLAGALDAVFAAAGRSIAGVLDALAGVSMPGAGPVSVLEFGSFLLAMVVVSALVCGALVRISRWTDEAPLGEWLAGLGVVFGAVGIAWTLLPVPAVELSTLHALLIVGAVGVGALVAAVATRAEPVLAMRRHVRADR